MKNFVYHFHGMSVLKNTVLYTYDKNKEKLQKNLFFCSFSQDKIQYTHKSTTSAE